MIIRIDQMSPNPVCLQIRDQIVGAIARGELEPADRLPSVRALASGLGVNLNSVRRAVTSKGSSTRHGPRPSTCSRARRLVARLR